MGQSNKSVIQSEEELNDRHMDAVSQLLQDQFVGDSGLSPPLALALPDIFRYRAPVNAQVYNFIGKYYSSTEYGTNCSCIPGHWLVVSTVGCSPGTVKVYYSALPAWGTKYFSTPRGNVLEKSLAILLSNNYSEITVEFVKCTQQRGVTVCGLYATAHVTGLCCGQDQVTVLYDQAVMQSSSREEEVLGRAQQARLVARGAAVPVSECDCS